MRTKTFEQVRDELTSEGYAFVCSMCSRMHRARARGAPACDEGEVGFDCGGPMSGKAFPRYEGPLSRHLLPTLCFRCGSSECDHAVRVGSGEFLGVCDKHVGMLSSRANYVEKRIKAA